jgi:hypothetical protein
MTLTELKVKFESGETLKIFFGTRQSIYSIGDERITYSKFQKLLKEYPQDKVNFEGDWKGITKHYYTYKK